MKINHTMKILFNNNRKNNTNNINKNTLTIQTFLYAKSYKQLKIPSKIGKIFSSCKVILILESKRAL